MKKTLITIIMGFMAITGGVFAHDCSLVEEADINTIAINNPYPKVIPEAAFKQAYINLKAYCCSKVIPKSCTDQEKNSLPKIYPESAELFDQLLDITMRRLDGVASLAYGLEPDPTGLARRIYITDVAKDPTGKQAMEIAQQYKVYRKWNALKKKTKDELKNINNMYDYDKNNPDTLNTFSLKDKYDTLCAFMKDIYEDTKTNNRRIIGSEYEKNSFFRKCKNTVDNRVYREMSYVKLLMIKKSSQLLDESTKAYTKKYFVEEKLMGLRNLIAKVQDMFTTIVQQAPASKTCSK